MRYDSRDHPHLCGFEAKEWHMYIWPNRSMYGAIPLVPAGPAQRIVIHISSTPRELHALPTPSHLWIPHDLSVVLPQRNLRSVDSIIFVRDGTDTPWTLNLHGWGANDRRVIDSLHWVFEHSDARLVFIGWEDLTSDDLQGMGLDMTGVVPQDDVPLAVSAIMRSVVTRYAQGNVNRADWSKRFVVGTREEWRELSAYPDFALDWPPVRCPCDLDLVPDVAPSVVTTPHSPERKFSP
jgi:hypothetical protein